MRGKLFTLCATASLLLALLWVASYRRPLVLRASRTPQDVWFLDASHGRLRLMQQRVRPARLNGLAIDAQTLHTITARDAAGRAVLTSRDPFTRDPRNPWWFDENAGNFLMDVPGPARGVANCHLGFVCVPIWFLVAAAALPAVAARAVAAGRRRRRARAGLCTSCGYDLHATPHRCPECGATAATVVVA